MEFFSGFKWAVPIAFTDAVASCCFEEGDILYDTKHAYFDDWESAHQKIGYSLQVRYPEKARRVKSEGKNSLEKNWNNEIRIDLYKNLRKVGAGQIHTTQGRLYTMLWKDDISVLYETTDNPPVPKTVNDAKDYIHETRGTAEELAEGAKVFVMARDLSNITSREKYAKVLAAMHNYLVDDPYVMTTKAAGLSRHEEFAPTVEIAFFVANVPEKKDLHDIIKNAVYIPGKSSNNGMFRISIHGAIF